MQQYLNLLQDILDKGQDTGDRTGTGTRSVFGRQLRFDMKDGFPLVTTKKIYTKALIHELLWFISGDTNVKYLQENGVRIWDEWADDKGDLGPVYGAQWRKYLGAKEVDYVALGKEKVLPQWDDQLAQVIEGIKTNPTGRRHIVNSWNVPQINEMALPPCHCLFQFYVANEKLSCQLYQRSADIFLGVPFNIASYALLTHLMAKVCGLEAGDFVHTFGDLHLYHNHFDQAKLQLSRKPKALPRLELEKGSGKISGFNFEDIQIIGYEHHPMIKAPVAV